MAPGMGDIKTALALSSQKMERQRGTETERQRQNGETITVFTEPPCDTYLLNFSSYSPDKNWSHGPTSPQERLGNVVSCWHPRNTSTWQKGRMNLHWPVSHLWHRTGTFLSFVCCFVLSFPLVNNIALCSFQLLFFFWHALSFVFCLLLPSPLIFPLMVTNRIVAFHSLRNF